jgi:hypothetical protein
MRSRGLTARGACWRSASMGQLKVLNSGRVGSAVQSRAVPIAGYRRLLGGQSLSVMCGFWNLLVARVRPPIRR